ncbi:membrane associated rhomboid family serine protease [Nocardioides marinisabuli]|uniref:Membrane associated rhomboid family serine protease n=1 Tax=Nocardioides marinisabuli TaxID=419476 RepID=A0A7Y9JQU5_9ACTN|nr:rhomboid family intramembrane serine protease [Nocardioides marinisabuli]NYD57591.1 membrane associated rhomboid family serine protease [Nocardioides marinisabuli]
MSTSTPTRTSTWPIAAAVSLGFVALLWVLEIGDQLTPGATLDDNGIRPRTDEGLVGVLLAPLLHGSWGHLISNSGLALLLFFLVLVGSVSRGLLATAVIWAVAGLGTWLVAGSGTSHIGASGLVFGWLTYLVVRGFFARSAGQIVVGLVLFLMYGSILWGVLPGQPGISWQGHLFGALGGVLAARLLAPSRVATR